MATGLSSSSFSAEATDAREELKNERAKRAVAERIVKGQEDYIAELEGKHKKVDELYRGKAEELREVSAKLESAENDMEAVYARLKHVEDENAVLRKRVVDNIESGDSHRLLEQNEQLTQELVKLETAIAENEETSGREAAAMADEIRVLKEKMKKGNSAGKEEALRKAEADLDTARADMNKKSRQISELNKKVATLTKRLQDQTSTAEERESALFKEVDKAYDQGQANEKRLEHELKVALSEAERLLGVLERREGDFSHELETTERNMRRLLWVRQERSSIQYAAMHKQVSELNSMVELWEKHDDAAGQQFKNMVQKLDSALRDVLQREGAVKAELYRIYDEQKELTKISERRDFENTEELLRLREENQKLRDEMARMTGVHGKAHYSDRVMNVMGRLENALSNAAQTLGMGSSGGEDENDVVCGVMRSLRNEIDVLRSTSESRGKDLAKVRKDWSKATEVAHSSVNELRSKVASLASECGPIEKPWQQSVDAVASNVMELAKRRRDSEESTKKELHVQEETIRSLRAQLDETMRERDQGREASARERIEADKTIQKEINHARRMAEKTVEEMKEVLDKKEQEVRELREQVKTIKEQEHSAVRSAERRLSKLKEDMTVLLKTLEDKDGYIARLRIEIQEEGTKLDRDKEIMEVERSQVEMEFQARLDALRVELDMCQAENQRLVQKNRSIGAALEAESQSSEEIRKSLEEMNKSHDIWEVEYVRVREELKIAQHRSNTQQDGLMRMEEELDSHVKSLGELHTELSNRLSSVLRILSDGAQSIETHRDFVIQWAAERDGMRRYFDEATENLKKVVDQRDELGSNIQASVQELLSKCNGANAAQVSNLRGQMQGLSRALAALTIAYHHMSNQGQEDPAADHVKFLSAQLRERTDMLKQERERTVRILAATSKKNVSPSKRRAQDSRVNFLQEQVSKLEMQLQRAKKRTVREAAAEITLVEEKLMDSKDDANSLREGFELLQKREREARVRGVLDRQALVDTIDKMRTFATMLHASFADERSLMESPQVTQNDIEQLHDRQQEILGEIERVHSDVVMDTTTGSLQT